MIHRLSYCVPPHLLRTLTYGLLVGKIMAAAPAGIPYKITQECTPDYTQGNARRGAITHMEKIDVSINNAGRSITKLKLSDKISSKKVLNKAGLTCLNEMVASASALLAWNSKRLMDPLGNKLFSFQNLNPDSMQLRSATNDFIKTPVPGYPNLAVNLMANAWNENVDLRCATTHGFAKEAAKQWAKAQVTS